MYPTIPSYFLNHQRIEIDCTIQSHNADIFPYLKYKNYVSERKDTQEKKSIFDRHKKQVTFLYLLLKLITTKRIHVYFI